MPDRKTTCDWRSLNRLQLPAFHVADLRLVGDILSEPVTRAIRNDTFKFRRPDWSEGRPRLDRIGLDLIGALTQAIKTNLLSFREPPRWGERYCALYRVFGLSLPHHFFKVEPIAWAKFTEPQLTKGIKHFLHPPGERVHIGRVRALLKALGMSQFSEDAEFMSEVAVEAEETVWDKKRIDLLIKWKYSEKEYAVAIEAKLGHSITRGQLPAYRTHVLQKLKIDENRRLLIVVLPHRTEHTSKKLRENRNWRWMTWRDLLITHERALHGGDDDGAYRQFRRTLWEQTG